MALNPFQKAAWQMAGATLLLFVAILVIGGWAIHNSRQQDRQIKAAVHDNCIQTQSLDQYIYSSILRSEKTLPTITYYRHHPRELRIQLKLIEESKADFKPKSCKGAQ